MCNKITNKNNNEKSLMVGKNSKHRFDFDCNLDLDLACI